MFKIRNLSIFAYVLLISLFMPVERAFATSNSHSTVDDDSVTAAFNALYADWRVFLAWLSGIATLTCILAFIVLMIKLGAAGDNPYERRKVMKELMIVLITTALTGSATLIFALMVQTIA